MTCLEGSVALLEGVKPDSGDIFESAAICIMDLDDMLKAKDKKAFKKQRKDCLKTMKAFYFKEVKKLKFCPNCVDKK